MNGQPPQPKKRRSFGFRAAVVLVTGGTLYPLSAGPAVWLRDRGTLPQGAMVIYLPLDLAWDYGPRQTPGIINWYLSFWHTTPVNHHAS